MTRETTPNWESYGSGDPDWEILKAVIKARDITNAASIGIRVAAIIAGYGTSDDITNAQVTLRAWQVEVVISAPTGLWWSESQRAMALELQETLDPTLELE